MNAPPRQLLTHMMIAAVQSTIEKDDQPYARQLATQFERQAMLLRATFGGTPMWAPKHAKLAAQGNDYLYRCEGCGGRWKVSANAIIAAVCPTCGGTFTIKRGHYTPGKGFREVQK